MGILGDRLGRKKVLVASLSLMGAATVAIGLLPTYRTAGVFAPLALLALRIVQGVAVGGEATGALLSGPLANVVAALVITTTEFQAADAELAVSVAIYATLVAVPAVAMVLISRESRGAGL